MEHADPSKTRREKNPKFCLVIYQFQVTVRNVDQNVLLKQLKRQLCNISVESACWEVTTLVASVPLHFLLGHFYSAFPMSLLYRTHQNIKEGFIVMRSASTTPLPKEAVFYILDK